MVKVIASSVRKGNVLDIDGAYTYSDNAWNDRTFTITATGETIYVDEYLTYAGNWSVI